MSRPGVRLISLIDGELGSDEHQVADYWAPVLNGEDRAAGGLREKYVFPHGIGWQVLAQAAGELIQQHGDDWAEVFAAAVAAINWERISPEFEGIAVIQDPITGKNWVNNTGPGVRALRNYILQAAEAASPRPR